MTVLVLLVERLGRRFGRSKDGLILGEGGCQGRDGLGISFRELLMKCLGLLRLVDLLNRGRLRIARILGNRFPGQEHRCVAGRRAGRLASGRFLRTGRGALSYGTREALRAISAAVCAALWATI